MLQTYLYLLLICFSQEMIRLSFFLFFRSLVNFFLTFTPITSCVMMQKISVGSLPNVGEIFEVSLRCLYCLCNQLSIEQYSLVWFDFMAYQPLSVINDKSTFIHIKNFISNNSVQHTKRVPSQTIQSSISTQFSSIWPLDMTLLGVTTPSLTGPGSNSNEEVLTQK